MVRRFLLWTIIVFWIFEFRRCERPNLFLGPYSAPFEEHQLQNVSLRRFKKNAPPDNLKILLDRTSIIARIANGIALQAGLMDEKIPIDDAIGELLNFGTVKVSDVIATKSDKLEPLTKKLEGLPQSLDKSVKDLEDLTIYYYNQLIIDSESVKDVMNLPKKDDYFSALTEFQNDFDYTVVTTAKTTLDEIVSSLKEIEVMKANSTTPIEDLRMMFNKFNGLIVRLPHIERNLSPLKALSGVMTKHKILGEGEATFKPIEEIIRLQKLRSAKPIANTDSQVPIVQNNFQKVFDLANASSNSLSSIKTLTAMTEARTFPSKPERIHTSGFAGGLSAMRTLTSDVQDSWFKMITNGNISAVSMSKGLQPLLGLKDQLTLINDNLQETSSKTNYGSLKSLNQVQKEISLMTKESVDSALVISKIQKCADKALSSFQSQTSEDVIKNVKVLDMHISNLEKVITTLDVAKLKSDFQALTDSFGFTNLENNAVSSKELPGVLQRMGDKSQLISFKNKVIGIQKGIADDKLDEKVKNVVSGKDNVDSFTGLQEESQVYVCLGPLKKESEIAINAIQIIQKLRILDPSEIQNVRKVMNSVTSAAPDLTKLRSIPQTMNNEATEFTKELNGMKDYLAISSTIGHSVNALRNAYGLKMLKPSVNQLKSAGNDIDKVIQSIQDQKVQMKVKSEWGDLNKDINSWNNVIGQVEMMDIGLNFTLYTTMNSYGGALTGLNPINDVQIDTKSKIQALDTLIPLANDPTKLQTSKKILEQLDDLDLSFSSHKTAISSVPNAFDQLFQFLVGFSKFNPIGVPGSPRVGAMIAGSSTEKTKKEESGPDYKIIAGATAGSLIFPAAIAAIIFILYKHFTKKKLKKNLRKWIRRQMFRPGKYCDAFTCHESYMKAMEIHAGEPDREASYNYLPKSKHRGADRLCLIETALHHLKKDGQKMPIHANLVVAADGKKFYATQAPMLNVYKKDDTCEEFWHMCMSDGIENIVMLIEYKDMKEGAYYPNEVDKTMTFGWYEIKCISEGTLEGTETVKVIKLQVRDTSGTLRTRVITHYNYTSWPDMSAPKGGDWVPSHKILEEVTKSKKPIVVHCMAGIGRTMAFIGLHTVTENVKRDPSTTIGDELSKLRAARYHAVQTLRQSYWLQVAAAHKLNMDYDLGMEKELKEMLEMFINVARYGMGNPEYEAKQKAKKEGIKYVKPKEIEVTNSQLGKVVVF